MDQLDEREVLQLIGSGGKSLDDVYDYFNVVRITNINAKVNSLSTKGFVVWGFMTGPGRFILEMTPAGEAYYGQMELPN